MLKWLERVCLLAGALMVGVFGLSRWHAHHGYQQALEQFEQQLSVPEAPAAAALGPVIRTTWLQPAPITPVSPELAPQAPTASPEPPPAHVEAPPPQTPSPLYLTTPLASPGGESGLLPEASRWSESRRAGYQRASQLDNTQPRALLEIPGIDLVVPVFDGLAERLLNKGVGRIPNGGRWDGEGNLALAGHRDGFFRRLGELERGDALWVTDAQGQQHRFEVDATEIVEPDAVSVLAPGPAPALTLVTCYPFHFLGSAPQRYIVKAVRSDEPDLVEE
ncbi:class D sortase [Ferrimonas balearica]|uniref:class D sortase n=1 Tax=Ferrimonas balearica TaxID=44012 RepID=UPI001C996047|nr:class D sortase [Ferrimonas balearica]MBY5991854.1 sortase [Ferrimonas balearica]